MQYNVITETDLVGKNVILRLDLNVPMRGGSVIDDTRIRYTFSQVNQALSVANRVLILSHLGCDQPSEADSTIRNLLPLLEKHYGVDVLFFDYNHKLNPKDHSNSLIVAENTRLNKSEKLNDPLFAKNLASMGDIYINDAFSVSHRSHASVVGITNYIQSFAGISMHKEIQALSSIDISESFVILGGGKVDSKLKVALELTKKCKNLFLGGLLGREFILQRYMLSDQYFDIVNEISSKAYDYGCNLIVPIDLVILDKNGVYSNVSIDSSKILEQKIVDIGVETRSMLCDVINKSNGVVCNGPLGIYEVEQSSHGTAHVLNYIAERTKSHNLISILGGGDIVACANMINLSQSDFTLTSTSGGAMMVFLLHKTLPGIIALEESAARFAR